MASVKVQAVKSSKSHAIRLEKAELRDDEVRVGRRRVTLQALAEKLTLRELLARITPKNLHNEQDWGKPAGREVR